MIDQSYMQSRSRMIRYASEISNLSKTISLPPKSQDMGMICCLSEEKSLSPLSFEPFPKRVILNSPPPSPPLPPMRTVLPFHQSLQHPMLFHPCPKEFLRNHIFLPIPTSLPLLLITRRPPLQISRFTKMQPNNNKILRQTLSEPPVFNSFSDFCRYMNSQSPKNDKNNAISIKLPLRRSISDPSADIILPPASAPVVATPALASEIINRKVGLECRWWRVGRRDGVDKRHLVWCGNSGLGSGVKSGGSSTMAVVGYSGSPELELLAGAAGDAEQRE
ncbi:hypothetical protein RND71_029776 [Anisodus tanguticus]|uniref:Uncharacterized protein n=1 Tax=Anisodus tanguticus TaxID=243964 RepID=A0AAE1RG54_9SOLA|nr:hypothetical protein RND71_029776 [Anisodus tanguticus]